MKNGSRKGLADSGGQCYDREVNLIERSKKTSWHVDPILVGTLCGIISALVYSAANISLRAVSHLDPFYVSWVKAIPTTTLTLPWVFYRWKTGGKIFPDYKTLFIIIGSGLFGQIVGNVGIQYALGVIGLAVSVPILFGTMIILGAAMGRLFLSEPISPRSALSILMLLAAIIILSFGAKNVNQDDPLSLATSLQNNPWHLFGGIMAAALCGLAYAVLGVAIRHVSQKGMPVSSTLFIVSLCGTIPLGLISATYVEVEEVRLIPLRDWQYMLAGGIFNAIAFLALTKALSLTSVVHVNALNATQTAMAGIAGLLLFREEANVALGIGITLTILGLLLLRPSTLSRSRRAALSPSLEKDAVPTPQNDLVS